MICVALYYNDHQFTIAPMHSAAKHYLNLLCAQIDKRFSFQCNGQLSLDAFFDGIGSEPVKIGVIGCGCSVATEPVAAIVHFWSIPLVWLVKLAISSLHGKINVKEYHKLQLHTIIVLS